MNNTELLDDIEYKNGSKNHWRRTMWNRLREQIPDPRDAIILYLPGSKDLDREEALRRGFKPWNLIAIERDKKIAKLLRNKGTITINEDLNDVVRCWPRYIKLSAIIGDLQCGITEESCRLLELFWNLNLFCKVLLVLNLQRGRESGSFSSFVRENTKSEGPWKDFAAGNDISSKHRCALVMAGVFAGIAKRAVDHHRGHKEPPYNLEELSIKKEVMEFILSFVHFQFLPTYRSTDRSPLFDSCLFIKKPFPEDFEWPAVMAYRKEQDVRGCISAALAVRTMKMGH